MMAGRECSLPLAAVVTGSAFIIQFLYAGTYYCTGLFFYHFIVTYGAGKAATVLVMSLVNGSLYTSGVVSGPLIAKYGTRPVAVIGTIMATVGLMLSSFAPHLWMLYISYGIITGFSWGFLMTASAVSVQQHTSKRRAFAAGMSYLGSGLGGLSYPLLFRWLESTLGWRGTLLIMAGLQLNCLPPALLLLPPKPLKIKQEVVVHLASDEKPSMASGKTQKEGIQASIPLMTESEKCPPQSRNEMDEAHGTVGIMVNHEVCSEEHVCGVAYQPETNNSCQSFLHKIYEVVIDTKTTLKGGGLASLACIISYMCRFTGVSVMYGFLPMKVTSSGFGQSEAAYLLSILHSGELVGRAVTTFTSCLHDRLPLIFFVTATLIGGVLEASISYTQTLLPMIVIVSAAGICFGVATCVGSTVVRDMVGIEKFPWVLGLAFGAAGISNLFLMQLLGLLWQETGDISMLFIIAGVSLACAALSYLVYLGCCKRAHKP